MYYLEEDKISLSDLQKRIEETDLVPSRLPLRDNTGAIFDALGKAGIGTLGDLRKALKTSAKVKEFSRLSDIDETYLILLRREVNSYFPKVYRTKELPFLSKGECRDFIDIGLENSRTIYETLIEKEGFRKIESSCGMKKDSLIKILHLVDLMRIQWTGPSAAQLFYESGYKSPEDVTEADAEEFFQAVNEVNLEKGYFKGKISLRDMRRVIQSAQYLLRTI